MGGAHRPQLELKPVTRHKAAALASALHLAPAPCWDRALGPKSRRWHSSCHGRYYEPPLTVPTCPNTILSMSEINRAQQLRSILLQLQILAWARVSPRWICGGLRPSCQPGLAASTAPPKAKSGAERDWAHTHTHTHTYTPT